MNHTIGRTGKRQQKGPKHEGHFRCEPPTQEQLWVVFVVEEEEKDFIQLVWVVGLDAIDDRSHFMSVGLFVNQRVDDDVRSDASKTQSGKGVDSATAIERVVIDEAVGKTGVGNVVVLEEAHDGVDAVSRDLFVVFGHPFHKLEETIDGFFRISLL